MHLAGEKLDVEAVRNKPGMLRFLPWQIGWCKVASKEEDNLLGGFRKKKKLEKREEKPGKPEKIRRKVPERLHKTYGKLG
jgi:hypothetical protein